MFEEFKVLIKVSFFVGNPVSKWRKSQVKPIFRYVGNTDIGASLNSKIMRLVFISNFI